MVDKIRGSPLVVGNLQEVIDDDHAIVCPHADLEYYVTMLSIVDRDMLEPNCSVLLKH